MKNKLWILIGLAFTGISGYLFSIDLVSMKIIGILVFIIGGYLTYIIGTKTQCPTKMS
jgi:hypothetical protein